MHTVGERNVIARSLIEWIFEWTRIAIACDVTEFTFFSFEKFSGWIFVVEIVEIIAGVFIVEHIVRGEWIIERHRSSFGSVERRKYLEGEIGFLVGLDNSGRGLCLFDHFVLWTISE